MHQTNLRQGDNPLIFRINDINSTRSAITSSKINYSDLIGAHSTIGSGSEEFQRWLPDAIQHLEYYDKIINLKEFPNEVIDTFFSFMNSRLLFSSVRPWLRQRSDWGTFIEAVYFDNQDRTWKKLPNRIFVSIDAIRLIGNKFYFRWSPFCYLYVNTGKNTYFVCLNLDQKLCVGVRIKNPEFLHGNTNPDCHQDNIASSFSEKVERCTLSIFEHANSPRVMYQTKQIINLNGCNVRKTGTSFNLKFRELGIFFENEVNHFCAVNNLLRINKDEITSTEKEHLISIGIKF